MGVVMGRTRTALRLIGSSINRVISFLVFLILDILDVILCVFYRLVDFLVEAEWKPCYCSSAKDAITSSGNILVSEKGENSKVLCVCSSKLQLDDISDTLYRRPSLAAEMSKTMVEELKRLKVEKKTINNMKLNSDGGVRSAKFTINSTIIEMLLGKMGRQHSPPIPRWSDCDCKTCNSWSSTGKDTLFVHAEGPKADKVKEDVLFIHGFISSSAFWTETLFPNFSAATKSSYRLIAVDLLGFGRSPKPNNSLYTLGEHVDMIHRSVIQPYKLKSFHIVAHSLGCILALAIADMYPGTVKSLTLLAPPCFTLPKGENATQYVMRKIAPRRVWPLIAFGASMACWYEHVSRTICLLICKNHRLWEFLIKLVTRNRVKTFLVDGFCCHTHNAAWHTLHNIICGSAVKVDGYLDAIRDGLKCDVNVFHGENDELVPVECSYALKSRIPRACVKVIDKKDHITIVVGRQKTFAGELEEIWRNSSN